MTKVIIIKKANIHQVNLELARLEKKYDKVTVLSSVTIKNREQVRVSVEYGVKEKWFSH